MSRNLKARLGRYRDAVKTKDPIKDDLVSEVWPGWTEAGFKTIKRKLTLELLSPVPDKFCTALAILVPDLLRVKRIPQPSELLFFDLETSGLSGGAGTLAFLAAFGRFATSPRSSPARLDITQYLLLDYPGECDFVELLVKEFASAEGTPLVVSYNGKSFDAQILSNRCLMNRISPPELSHVDLLHPSRRLWKRLLADCSQSTIEVSVLGLDRTGDISGALAPDIWFSFLRSGESSELLSVCEHNVKDITGLANLFLTLEEIANEPLRSRFRFDEGSLALYWRKALRKNPAFFKQSKNCGKTGRLLLERAAGKGHVQAALVLAIDAEWRLKDPALALRYTESALKTPELPDKLKCDLEKRRTRLKEKCVITSKNTALRNLKA